MPVSQFITDLPDTFISVLTSITSTISGMLLQTFGSYETYAVMALALILGYLIKAVLSKSDSYFWYVVLSALIFMSLRYLGI